MKVKQGSEWQVLSAEPSTHLELSNSNIHPVCDSSEYAHILHALCSPGRECSRSWGLDGGGLIELTQEFGPRSEAVGSPRGCLSTGGPWQICFVERTCQPQVGRDKASARRMEWILQFSPGAMRRPGSRPRGSWLDSRAI